jgi:hypothetical protein
LRPLKLQPRDLALRVPVLVGPRASVVYEGQSYAMPPEAVGLIGVLRLYPDRVEIAAGRYETTHTATAPGGYVHAARDRREHRPPPRAAPRRTIARVRARAPLRARSRSRHRSAARQRVARRPLT